MLQVLHQPVVRGELHGLTHFEYFVFAMLSEAPERTLRMTALGQRTDATLARLSHVVRRLEEPRPGRPVPLP